VSFSGYKRPDGSAGIRNDVLVLPGGYLASKICDFVPGVRTILTADSIDFYSGTVLQGQDTIESAGEKLLNVVLDIASGTLTRVETLRHTDPTQIYLKEPPF
jgi:altronate dehydratase